MCKAECKTNCRGIVYQLDCRECCKILYRGQTSRSGNERINAHFLDWEEHKAGKRAKKSILWEHSCTHHNSDNYNDNVSVLSQNFGDTTKRLITGSIIMDELIDEELMDSKKEWLYVHYFTW